MVAYNVYWNLQHFGIFKRYNVVRQRLVHHGALIICENASGKYEPDALTLSFLIYKRMLEAACLNPSHTFYNIARVGETLSTAITPELAFGMTQFFPEGEVYVFSKSLNFVMTKDKFYYRKMRQCTGYFFPSC